MFYTLLYSKKMKKLTILALIVSLILIGSSNAFAHWKCPEGIEIQDPAPIPIEIDLR